MLMSEYREKAEVFAIYKDPDYPKWLIAGEAGELVGLFAKSKRGDFHEPPREDVVKEMGDILWGLALAQDDEYEFGKHTAGAGHYTDWLTRLNWHCAELLDNQDDMDWRCWVECCLHLEFFASAYGISIEEISEANLQKLESRQQRGKIQGNGDNR